MRRLTADELKKLSPADLEKYQSALEEIYWEAGKDNFRDFCQRVEVPGAPIPDEDDYYCSTIEPAQHHDLLIDGVQALAEGRYPEIDGIMAFLPPGSAKALALDTPIPTPSGWSMMGDLKVGDKVFDETGTPCSVTWVSPIHKNRPVYSVLTDCGDEIVADRDHEWLVKSQSGNQIIIETKDIGPSEYVVPRNMKHDGVALGDVKITAEKLKDFCDTICIEVDSPSHLFLCGRSMTPTHNSTYLSVLAPPWLMGRKPGTNVIACSYGQDLANRFGRRVRHIARSAEYERIMGTTITGDNQAVDNWSLLNGSDYRAAGMGAAVTGFRADWLLVDDPLKGREDADSETIRDKVYSGLMDDLMTRLKPGGKIIIALTRWHEDDPAGRILGEDWKGQSGLWRGTDGRLWLIINLPLIAENKDDPLGRPVGQLLWPEWFRQEEADRLMNAGKNGGTAARTWSSLYQQRPAPSEGAILSRSYWKEWKEKDLPDVDQVYLSYDTAFEDGEENDYSAMSAWGVFTSVSKKPTGQEYKHNHIILLGYWQDKINAVDLIKTVQLHCEKFRPDRVLVEKRASGIQLIQELQRRRIPVKAWLPRGKPGTKGKIPRAHAVAAILEQGSVWYVKGKRTEQLIDQCAAFPYGTHDDGVDSVTCALSYFRDKWIFMTKDDELDERELEEALLHRSDQRRSSRSLYGSKKASRGDQITLDEAEIANMTDDTRKRMWDERTRGR